MTVLQTVTSILLKTFGKRALLDLSNLVISIAGWCGGLGVQPSCAQTARRSAAEVTVINVTVIAMEQEGAVPAQTVLVRNGKIAAIVPAKNFHPGPTTLIVDGSGKFLIPELADM